jgi:Transposase
VSGFAVMLKLVLNFRSLLRVGKLAALRRWMKRAQKTGIYALTRFVRTLQQDLRAVEAAVTKPWSNGPVEGHINRLKTLQRQMYGRAGVKQLRARLLPESRIAGQIIVQFATSILYVIENTTVKYGGGGGSRTRVRKCYWSRELHA